MSFDASCPPDYSQKISLGITSFDLKMSYEPLCQFAINIKYYVIASGFILASLILIGYSKS
ncbi:virulence factor TspB C-terminal domain-related protein [Acinetobacter guillouiae]|uniref:virulence factor TspB C-terminal domain-related protein n=1 Tax=Acinetobacter guillouiae TaxID=106649 RepID=UPI003A5229DF